MGSGLSFVDPLIPEPGDLDRQTGLTTFQDQYTRRAFGVASTGSLALGVVHSHPEGSGISLYREFAAFSGGAPYCSLILQRSESTGLTFSGRIYDRGDWISLESLLTVGKEIERHESEASIEVHSAPECEALSEQSVTERLEALFGRRSVVRLRGATVGVVGCGGTGSPAIHVLARHGVGSFVFVDPERLSISNLEREHGAFWDDLHHVGPPAKVDLMRRMVKTINPSARTFCLMGNILHENVLDELLRCDVLLGCVDSYHGRVALSDYSRHYLLPTLDLGVLMDGAIGSVTSQVAEFTRYMPDDPCAFCLGRIDSAALSFELLDGHRTGGP